MSNIFFISDLKASYPEIKSLALGKFDGMHLAHFELFKKLKQPSGILMLDFKVQNYLCSFQQRANFVESRVFVLDLDRVKNWSGAEFVLFLKKAFPSLEKIVVGYDFYFGKNRSCDSDDLILISRDFDIKVEVMSEVKIQGVSVHTQAIKKALLEADLDLSLKLLGRYYAVYGRRVAGQGLGHRELFATINLSCGDYFLPKNGVYATRFEGIQSVSFIGNRSTDGKFSVEVHLLDTTLSREILDRGDLKLEFISYIRENQTFSHLEKLKQQITRDISKAREIFKNLSHYDS